MNPSPALLRRTYVLAALLGSTIAANAQIVLNTVDRGWYDDTGRHISTSHNYFTGAGDGHEYRSFFVFDLSGLTGTDITSAKFRVYNPRYGFWGISENIMLYGFTGNIDTLVGGGSGLTGIFDDLGDAPSYSSSIAVNAGSIGFLEFTLNGNFMNDAEDLIGLGEIAFGIKMSSLSEGFPNQYIFGQSQYESAIDGHSQLILNGNVSSPRDGDNNVPVPEPSTYGLIGAAALLGLVARRRFSAKGNKS